MIILVGSLAGLIVDLGRLQKKFLARCQISSSKSELLQFHEKRFSVWSRTCSIESRANVGV